MKNKPPLDIKKRFKWQKIYLSEYYNRNGIRHCKECGHEEKFHDWDDPRICNDMDMSDEPWSEKELAWCDCKALVL